MHDELRRFGLRRVRLWTGLLLVAGGLTGAVLTSLAMLDPTWPPTHAPVSGGWRTVGVGAVAGAVLALLLVLFGETSGTRRAWPTVPLTPAPDLVPLAQGLAIARGEAVPRVWRLTSKAPNVACLPRPLGRHLIVSTAAEAGLTRAELEAVMALQYSLLLDRDAARVRRALVAAGLLVTWSLRAVLLALAVVLVRHLVWAGLTINLAIWLPVAPIGLTVFAQRRVRWSWGMVGDAVAIETTRHPEPLVTALRRLAGHNEGVVPVRRTWGAADPYWALPVRARMQVASFVVGEKARNRRSTEQQADAALLLRARIVEKVCLGQEPATVASWEEVEATFERLGRAAGDGSADGTIDGVTVGVEGATVGALAPEGGTWTGLGSTHEDADARSARPRLPDRAAIAAYDAAVAGLPPS